MLASASTFQVPVVPVVLVVPVMSESHPEIDKIRARFLEAMAAVQTTADLKAVRDNFVGRTKGELSNALKQISFQPPAARPAFGAAANALKHEIDQTLELRELELVAQMPAAGGLDITLPGRVPIVGRRHPLTQVRERVEDIFLAMGYQIIEGPEVEDDWHNFEALNMPPEHPARDMQDTLYLQSALRSSADPRPGGK